MCIRDSINGIVRVRFENPYSIEWSVFNPENELTDIAISPEFDIGQEKLILLLATKDFGLYEIDWTDINSPFEQNSYDLNPATTFDVENLDMSDKFIICQTLEITAAGEVQDYLNIYQRGQKLLKNVYLRFEVQKSVVPFFFNEFSQEILIFSSDSINVYSLGEANVELSPQQPVQNLSLIHI
eukprot:TRINITY_DN4030_c0_g1_i7.p1 TRINITY_DN4030_c0_g1~~TRINITY_DN4030_c0_g1_i7.p1  ORF type:complete len:183 (-),score=38.86 TRINITY_DN4030_c0_g1_i7:4-552(-)